MFTDDVECLTLAPVTFTRACPSRCSRRNEATLTLPATFGRQITALVAAEVLYFLSLNRHFSLTVNFLCHNLHNSSVCTVNKDRKSALGGRGGAWASLIQKTIGPSMLDLSPAVDSLLFSTLKFAPQKLPAVIGLCRYGASVFIFPCQRKGGGGVKSPFSFTRAHFFLKSTTKQTNAQKGCSRAQHALAGASTIPMCPLPARPPATPNRRFHL